MYNSLKFKIYRRLGWRNIHHTATIKGNVRLGKGIYVGADAEFVALKGETISIGDYSLIFKGVLLYPFGGSIIIGNRAGINPYTVIYGHGGVNIGENVLIASHCVIIPANHRFDSLEVPINSQGETCLGITIEDDVWLGARVTVLDGVTIGRGAVIGAGAVVTKDIPPYAVAVGVPAQVIRMRTDQGQKAQEA